LSWAIGLTTGAQMGVSRAVPAGGSLYHYWTVWARRTDGHIMSLRESPGSPSPRWYDWGIPGGDVPSSVGVSATSWTEPAGEMERVFYVAGNKLYMLGFLNGTPLFGWVSIKAPAGLTFTGHVAASRRLEADGTIKPVVYVSFTNGSMRALLPSASPPTWQPLKDAGTVSTSSPLAATASGTSQYTRVFYVLTNPADRIEMKQWSSQGGWVTATVGQPLNVPVCGTMAAAEGDTQSSAGYRIYLFCTRKGGTPEASIRYAYETGVSGTNGFSWGSKATPDGSTTRNTGYAIAATARPSQPGTSIEAFVPTATNKLLTIRHLGGTIEIGTLEDLGTDTEIVTMEGGLAATPSQTGNGYSFGFFLGPRTSSGHLYRRVGDPTQVAGNPWNWGSHGPGDGTAQIDPDGPNTESGTALYQGKIATAALVMMAPGDNTATPSTQVRFSSNDGETWSAFTATPAVAGGYAADPTVDFDSTGTAWVSLFGIQRGGAYCNNAGVTATDISYYTTTNGQQYIGPTQIEQLPAMAGGVARHDHPWIAIYRNPNGSDRVHIVWLDRDVDNNGAQDLTIRLATIINGQTTIATVQDGQGGDPNFDSASIPIVTVGAGGKTYVVVVGTGGERVCRVDDTGGDAYTRCDTFFDLTYDFQAPTNSRVIFPGSASSGACGSSLDCFIDTKDFFSAVASPSDPNKVYLAWHMCEGVAHDDCTHLDAWFGFVTYVNGIWTEGPKLRLDPGGGDDGIDQFDPELTVTRDVTGSETIFATYYSTAVSSSNAPCNLANRCFHSRTAVSYDLGLSFVHHDVINNGSAEYASDPVISPTRCTQGPDYRFIGDFHHVKPGRLHSSHVIVESLVGQPNGTGALTRSWVSRGSPVLPWP